MSVKEGWKVRLWTLWRPGPPKSRFEFTIGYRRQSPVRGTARALQTDRTQSVLPWQDVESLDAPPGVPEVAHDGGVLLADIVGEGTQAAEIARADVARGFDLQHPNLARHRTGRERLVQVRADWAGPKTRDRELRALDEAMRALKICNAVIVTMREEEILKAGGKAVRVVPAWRWLLEPEES